MVEAGADNAHGFGVMKKLKALVSPSNNKNKNKNKWGVMWNLLKVVLRKYLLLLPDLQTRKKM